MIKSIHFENYKSFKDYTVHLSTFNILVGPNNCGKSTIIGALRILDMGFRKANSTRAISFATKSGQHFHGFRVNTDAVDVSTENVVYNYEKELEPKISFIFDKGKRAELYFLEDDYCYLTCTDNGVIIASPTQYRESFNETIKCIPILGPLEHNEEYVKKSTVTSNLNTHRASRNFRSYWSYFPENWDLFSKMVIDTWPGMEVEKPYLDDNNIYMMCKENRFPRELFWVGYGFQIWCQILTHISMIDDYSIVVVDEPEIYLHAEVQRQLVYLLKEIDKQIILATHSVEILGESNPDDVIIVEKETLHSYRIKNIDGLQKVVSLIGSLHNITLANLARTRKMICVENMYDFILLSKFMKIHNGKTLERSNRITPIQMEGSSFIHNVESFSWGLKEKFSLDIDIGIVIDRDFYSNEAIQTICQKLEGKVELIHVLAMKEIENYLLDVEAIARCVIEKSNAVKGISFEGMIGEIEKIYSSISETFKTYVSSQISAKQLDTSNRSIDQSSTIEQSLLYIEDIWNDLEKRKAILPGKKVLKLIRDEVQRKYRITISDSNIINHIEPSRIPSDMILLLEKINNFMEFRKT